MSGTAVGEVELVWLAVLAERARAVVVAQAETAKEVNRINERVLRALELSHLASDLAELMERARVQELTSAAQVLVLEIDDVSARFHGPGQRLRRASKNTASSRCSSSLVEARLHAPCGRAEAAPMAARRRGALGVSILLEGVPAHQDFDKQGSKQGRHGLSRAGGRSRHERGGRPRRRRDESDWATAP